MAEKKGDGTPTEGELLKQLRRTKTYQEQVGGSDAMERNDLTQEIARIEGELAALNSSQSSLKESNRGYGKMAKDAARAAGNASFALGGRVAKATGRMGLAAGGAVADYTWGKTKSGVSSGLNSIGSGVVAAKEEIKTSAKENTGTIWLFFAFIIAIIDALPGGGGPYGGFKDPYGFLIGGNFLENLLSAQTVLSSVFISYLLLRFLYNAGIKKQVRPFPLLIYLILANSMITLGGRYALTISTNSVIWSNVFFWLSLLAFFAVTVHNVKAGIPDLIDDIVYFLYAFFCSVLIVIGYGWFTALDIKPLIHLAFLLGFLNAYVKKHEVEDERVFHIIGIAAIVMDFFGTFLLKDVPILKFVPLLFVGVTFYIQSKEQNKWATRLFVIFILLSFAFNATEAKTNESGGPPLQKVEGIGVKEYLSNYKKVITGFFESKIKEATQFSGQVEKNQYESLGVYFSNLRPAQPRFYTDEPVVVWGAIRSKTYQDAVIVKAGCYYRKSGGVTSYLGDMVPKDAFPIFQLEDTDIECTFPNKNTFDAGTYPITFSASYNFATNAYQKIYFMDRERYRAYVRESAKSDADVLKQLGIKDPNPQPVFTNGPVEIGMKIGQGVPLLPVASPGAYNSLPAIFLTLTNRQQIEDKDKKIITRWEGKIEKIRELILLLPPGITLADSTDSGQKSCQPVPFKSYTETDCRVGCGEGTSGESTLCKTGCSQANNNACLKECERVKETCIKECEYLFKGEGVETIYNGYALDVSSIPEEKKSYYQNIGAEGTERYRTFSCRIAPSLEVLDNGPLTIRYIRVRAKYDYLLENTVQVSIEKPSDIVGSQGTTGTVLPSTQSIGRYDLNAVNTFAMINSLGDAAGQREIEHSPRVKEFAKYYDIDYLLSKAIIQQESTWVSNPQDRYEKAITGSGGVVFSDYSVGMMQILTSTAKERGCISNEIGTQAARDELRNVENNLNCGFKNLQYLVGLQQKTEYKKGIRTLAAGYNGGPGVMMLKTNGGGLAKWEDPSDPRSIKITNYVNSVMTTYNNLVAKVKQIQIGVGPLTFKAIYDSVNKKTTIEWQESPTFKSDSGIQTYAVRRLRGTTDEAIVQSCLSINPSINDVTSEISYKCEDTFDPNNPILPTPIPGATYTYELRGYQSEKNDAEPFIKKQASIKVPDFFS